jgi:hypothetical protein
MSEPTNPPIHGPVELNGWRPPPLTVKPPAIASLSFKLVDTADLATSIANLDQLTTAADIALLKEHVAALFLQVQSVMSAISFSLEDIRASVTSVTESHQQHYHLIPAGMATFTYNGDQIRALTAEGALYQPRPNDFRTELQGTSGPLTH